MSYNKTEWKTGDIVTSEGLNNIENGISALDFFSMVPTIHILNDGTGKSWGEPYDIIVTPHIDQELLDKWPKTGGFCLNVIVTDKNGDREWVEGAGSGRIDLKYDSGTQVGYYLRVVTLNYEIYDNSQTGDPNKLCLTANLVTYEYSFDTGLWTVGNTKYANPKSNFVFS